MPPLPADCMLLSPVPSGMVTAASIVAEKHEQVREISHNQKTLTSIEHMEK